MGSIQRSMNFNVDTVIALIYVYTWIFLNTLDASTAFNTDVSVEILWQPAVGRHNPLVFNRIASKCDYTIIVLPVTTRVAIHVLCSDFKKFLHIIVLSASINHVSTVKVQDTTFAVNHGDSKDVNQLLIKGYICNFSTHNLVNINNALVKLVVRLKNEEHVCRW